MGQAASLMSQDLSESTLHHWKWMMFGGVLAVVAGIVAILIPAVASVAIALFIGWVFVIAGAFQIPAAFSAGSFGHVVWRLLLALITVVAGIWLVASPLEGTITLTFVLACFFLASGVISVAGAMAARGNQGAGLIALSGILALIIGALVIAELPSSAAWAIGLLAGINFIFDGFALIATASAAHKEAEA